jgi:hypothetical protein
MIPVRVRNATQGNPREEVGGESATLATLGKRGANQRVQKVVYWLRRHERRGQEPEKVMDAALGLVGVKNGPAAALTKAALLRNLDIAEKLGCLDAEGLAAMCRGKTPTVQRGPYKGDQHSMGYIIPRAVCSELDNVIANLELMPLGMNECKTDRVVARQVEIARKFNKAGLLSDKGLKAVENSVR